MKEVLGFLLCVLRVSLSAADIETKGFDHFYNLEFDDAVAAFAQATQRQPGNPLYHNHLAQAVLYREMLRSGALESELVTGNNPFLRRSKLKVSEEDQQRFETSIAKSLELADRALATNPNDSEALYAQGVAYGLRGNYNFLVRKSWTDALKDATAARKAHDRLTKLKPDMADARLVEGVHDYVVGSLPWTYKMVGFLVGFRGDKDGGIRTLEMVAQKGVKNRNDAKILLGVVYRRERQPAKAVALIRDLLKEYPRNYLLRLELVQMYADLGDKEKALVELRNIEALKRSGSPGFVALPFEKINYARGNLLFWYRDYDWGIEELRKAAAKAKDLDLNTGSMAWLRLGQCLDMKQQRTPALESYRAAIALAPDSDAARQAKGYLTSPYKRGKD
ncbi:MAG: tetratricopeptide repeat protein [Bryobacterales bacterium]|nr:tetratricopeptide repeat protein [Bryobacterales bacterium]